MRRLNSAVAVGGDRGKPLPGHSYHSNWLFTSNRLGISLCHSFDLLPSLKRKTQSSSPFRVNWTLGSHWTRSLKRALRICADQSSKRWRRKTGLFLSSRFWFIFKLKDNRIIQEFPNHSRKFPIGCFTLLLRLISFSFAIFSPDYRSTSPAN